MGQLATAVSRNGEFAVKLLDVIADKSHTCERSRNPTGSLSGADRSTDADAHFWNSEDVYRQDYSSDAVTLNLIGLRVDCQDGHSFGN